jgi:hypothetical protein
MLRAEGRRGVLRLLAALLRRLTPDLVLPLLGIAASVLIGFFLSQALLEAQARAVAVAFALMAGYITPNGWRPIWINRSPIRCWACRNTTWPRPSAATSSDPPIPWLRASA